MNANQQFRILAPDGRLSRDTFALSAKQPNNIKAGCLLVVNLQSGGAITVHQTRLFLIENIQTMAPAVKPKSMCWKCGRVDGVVQDQVACPEHSGIKCAMLEPAEKHSKTILISD